MKDNHKAIPIGKLPQGEQRSEIEKLLGDQARNVGEYNALMKAQGIDETRMALAGIINEFELDQAAKHTAAALPGMQTPTREQLKTMQKWAAKYKRRNRFATEEMVMKAVANHFKLLIMDAAPEQPQQLTNATTNEPEHGSANDPGEIQGPDTGDKQHLQSGSDSE